MRTWIAVAAVGAIGCTSDSAPPPTPVALTPVPTAIPAPTPTPTPAPTPTPTTWPTPTPTPAFIINYHGDRVPRPAITPTPIPWPTPVPPSAYGPREIYKAAEKWGPDREWDPWYEEDWAANQERIADLQASMNVTIALTDVVARVYTGTETTAPYIDFLDFREGIFRCYFTFSKRDVALMEELADRIGENRDRKIGTTGITIVSLRGFDQGDVGGFTELLACRDAGAVRIIA